MTKVNGLWCLVWTVVFCVTPGCSNVGEHGPYGPHGSRSRVNPASDIGPNRAPTAQTLYSMSRVLASQGKEAEAAYTLEKLISTYPKFMPAYNDLAELHMRHNRYDEARRFLNEGLKRSPQDAVLTNNVGMCDLMERQYADALIQFERAVSFDPQTPRYITNMALALGMMGDYDAALDLYKTVLPAGQAHYNVAICCTARQDFDRADEERLAAKAQGFKGM